MSNENVRIKVDMKTGEGLIIDRPGLISKLRRYSEWSYNLFAWIFWLFLLRPIIILILWYLGVRIAYHQMVFMEGFNNPAFFGYGFLAVVVILLVAFGWNRYNFLRFRGTDRRKHQGDCIAEDLAKYYNVPTNAVTSFQMSPYVEIAFQSDETIEVNTGSQKTKALYAPQHLARQIKSDN